MIKGEEENTLHSFKLRQIELIITDFGPTQVYARCLAKDFFFHNLNELVISLNIVSKEYVSYCHQHQQVLFKKKSESNNYIFEKIVKKICSQQENNFLKINELVHCITS